jgi:hypothetical protein
MARPTKGTPAEAAERFAAVYERTGSPITMQLVFYYMLLDEVAKDEEDEYERNTPGDIPFA